jgi:hypothetical protein
MSGRPASGRIFFPGTPTDPDRATMSPRTSPIRDSTGTVSLQLPLLPTRLEGSSINVNGEARRLIESAARRHLTKAVIGKWHAQRLHDIWSGDRSRECNVYMQSALQTSTGGGVCGREPLEPRWPASFSPSAPAFPEQDGRLYWQLLHMACSRKPSHDR